MSHEDKSVTPVTTDSPPWSSFRAASATERCGVLSACDLDCKLNRTGHSRLKEGVPASLGEQLKPASTRTCVSFLEAARPHCGLTLSELQDIILILRLALGSPGDV